jgi:hypothetical protein
MVLAYRKQNKASLEEEMYRIEIVQVRLFDVSDGGRVIEAFNRIPPKPPPFRTALYHSAKVPNDWSIFFRNSAADNIESKSLEAVGFAESLRLIGFVDHSIWLPVPILEDQPALDAET